MNARTIKLHASGKRAWRLFAFAPLLAMTAFTAPVDPVTEATRQGDVNELRRLVQRGEQVDVAAGDGMTPLHWAAENGNRDIARILIGAGARVDSRTRIGGYTPLHLAIQAGHTDLVKLLIESGADVSSPREIGGATPLHLAAAARNGEEIIAALIKAGVDVNAREISAGQTPLMFAASYGRAESVKKLLAAGADPSLATPVIDVMEQFRMDMAASAYLQEQLGDARQPTPTQVQDAIRQQRAGLTQVDPSLADNQLTRISTLIGPGSEDGASNVGVREYLIGRTGGMTALLHAAREGQIETAMVLLDGGADINQLSGDGSSPLLIAARNGRYDLMMVLLQRGADPRIGTTTDGATPLFSVLESRWPTVSSFPSRVAYRLQRTGHVEVLEALLKAGADPNVQLRTHTWDWELGVDIGMDITAATPLWRAAIAQDVEAMRVLKSYGADGNIPTTVPFEMIRFGRTPDGRGQDDSGLPPVPEGEPATWPIHAAAGGGWLGQGAFKMRGVPGAFLDAVKFLVEEMGADVNEVDYWGYRPLHYAAARGDNDMVLYLVSKGADPAVISRLGQSPADMTRGGKVGVWARPRYPETEALLVSLGSPLVCEHTFVREGGYFCDAAGTTDFEDRYGFSRKPLIERGPDELYTAARPLEELYEWAGHARPDPTETRFPQSR